MRSELSEMLPESISLRLDAGTRRSDGGKTLIGGSPLRLVRVTEQGARIVDDLSRGQPVGAIAARQSVARKLLDTGLAHPVPAVGAPSVPVSISVTVVIPVRDDPRRLGDVIAAVNRGGHPGAHPRRVIVVDDGSVDPESVVSAAVGADVLRHDRPQGPAAARNAGWRAADTELVAFVDADVELPDEWLETLVAHLEDPHVAGAAPRVRGRPGGKNVIDRYERHRSPLDLGPDPALVVPGGRVSYVPTATIVYRRSVLEAMGGFDEGLRYGEDVDLVWRVAKEHAIRYVPDVEVGHHNRPSWTALVRQRAQYASSAAHLEQRHPGRVAPVVINVWSLVAWALGALGGRRGAVAGIAVAGASTAMLVPELRGRVDEPHREAVRLAGVGTLWAGRWLASAVIRAWLPVAFVASLHSRRARRAVIASAVVPALLEWRERRPDLDPATWTAARLVDDVAYCAGLWKGCVAVRSPAALRPRLSGIPGLTDR